MPRRRAHPLVFLVMVASFLLPFVTITPSCGDATTVRATGVQLVTDTPSVTTTGRETDPDTLHAAQAAQVPAIALLGAAAIAMAVAFNVYVDSSLELGWALELVLAVGLVGSSLGALMRLDLGSPALPLPRARARLTAWAIDLVVVACVASYAGMAAGPERMWRFPAAFILAGWVYRTACVASPWQATLGARIAGIRVVGPNGAPVLLGRAAARASAHWCSPLTLGAARVFACGRADRYMLHDVIAGTAVIVQAAAATAPVAVVVPRPAASPASEA